LSCDTFFTFTCTTEFSSSLLFSAASHSHICTTHAYYLLVVPCPAPTAVTFHSFTAMPNIAVMIHALTAVLTAVVSHSFTAMPSIVVMFDPLTTMIPYIHGSVCNFFYHSSTTMSSAVIASRVPAVLLQTQCHYPSPQHHLDLHPAYCTPFGTSSYH
jgi:hypothetical protein